MLDYWITFRSVTFAQRAQRIVEGAGVRTRLARAPKGLSERGCAYALLVSAQDAPRAVQELRAANVPFRKVVRRTPAGDWEEAAL